MSICVHKTIAKVSPDVHMAHTDQPEPGALTNLGVQRLHLSRAQLGIEQVHLKKNNFVK